MEYIYIYIYIYAEGNQQPITTRLDNLAGAQELPWFPAFLSCLFDPNWSIPGFSEWWSAQVKEFLRELLEVVSLELAEILVQISVEESTVCLQQLDLQITFQNTAEALAFVADLQLKRNLFEGLDERSRRAIFKPKSFKSSKKSKSVIHKRSKRENMRQQRASVGATPSLVPTFIVDEDGNGGNCTPDRSPRNNIVPETPHTTSHIDVGSAKKRKTATTNEPPLPQNTSFLVLAPDLAPAAHGGKTATLVDLCNHHFYNMPPFDAAMSSARIDRIHEQTAILQEMRRRHTRSYIANLRAVFKKSFKRTTP